MRFPHLRRVLLPWAATRLGLVLVGLLALYLLPSGLTLQSGNLVRHAPGPALLEMWARWDSEWYLLIAERGYGADDAFVGLNDATQSGDDTGFFPLYPLLVRLVSLSGLSGLAAGVLVSNLALLLALATLRSLLTKDAGETVADRAIWLVCAFPTSFFLSAVYAESLMLALLLAAVRLARDGRAQGAGWAAAACALSKPTGVLALLPVGVELFARAPAAARVAAGLPPPSTAARCARVGIAAAPTAIALGLYAAFCQAHYGRLAPFVERQVRSRGPTGFPWRAFARYFERPELLGAHHSTLDLVMAAGAVLMIPWLWRKARPADALYGTAAVLLPLGSTLWSFSRFAASIYPLFGLAARPAARFDGGFLALIGLMLPVGGFLFALYAAWWWVG